MFRRFEFSTEAHEGAFRDTARYFARIKTQIGKKPLVVLQLCARMYVCICVCMYVCMCVCFIIYAHAHTSFIPQAVSVQETAAIYVYVSICVCTCA